MKGTYKRTDKHRKKMSDIKLLNNPRKGVVPANKGLMKVSISKEELSRLYNIEQLSLSEIGKKIELSSVSVLNYTKRFNIKRRDLSTSLINRGLKGENHVQWKGDNITKGRFHRHVEKIKIKPEHCETCNNSSRLELSSNNHIYTRYIDDYEWLCRSCHLKKDYSIGKRTPRGKISE